MNDILFLTLLEVLEIHENQILLYGGSHGIPKGASSFLGSLKSFGKEKGPFFRCRKNGPFFKIGFKLGS